jgi:hypothetical protein
MSAAKLKLIEKKLEKIENWCEKYDSAGEARDSIDELPSPLHKRDTRVVYFDSISSELIDVSQTGESEEVVSTASKLQGKVEKSEHVLNVLINDEQIPAEESEAAARYLVDDPEPVPSAAIQEGLIDWAFYHVDAAVRRSAWLWICNRYAQDPPSMNAGGSHPKFGRIELKELRQKFMSQRAVLGPRGSVLVPAEIRPEAAELTSELLMLLADPEGADRREVALTLGEIGGPDVALKLADALRAELDENGTDEGYQAYLATALGKLGGPAAIDALLRAAKHGSETVRLRALSALESLVTGGYVALTEYPETVTIESAEMKDAYLYLSEQLSEIISAAEDLPYVRRKAEDLLDNVQTSLESVPAMA